MNSVLILLATVLFSILWLIATYNRLIVFRNRVKTAWSQIDVQLNRRYDLIPNLVETVKKYMAHEKETFEAVIHARNQATEALKDVDARGGPTHEGGLSRLLGAETALTGALGKIFALRESYPNLKAAENVAALQEELTSTENKVAYSRQAYNDEAMRYNILQESFPTMLVAGIFGHHPADLFQVIELEVREPVQVKI